MVDLHKGTITLPVNMILSNSGQLFFSSNAKAVKKVLDRSGKPKLGISNKSFNASVVQKLVMNSYIEEIYLREPELLSKRLEIIDTNNLIIYALLYRKLSPALAEMLSTSSVLMDYNRKNPRNQIHSISQIDLKTVNNLKAQKRSLFEMIEMEINSEVVQRILSNRELGEEDRLNRIKSLNKFLQCIDSRIWYLYLIIYQTSLKENIKNSFSDMIAEYLDRTKISIYMSNLLMELVLNSERNHFERIFASQHVKGEQLDLILCDAENRKWAVEEAVAKKQFLTLSWNISTEASFKGKNYRLVINIINNGLNNEAMKMQRPGDYQGDDLLRLTSEIGNMLITNIEALCKKDKINFRINFNADVHLNQTTSTVEFRV